MLFAKELTADNFCSDTHSTTTCRVLSEWFTLFFHGFSALDGLDADYDLYSELDAIMHSLVMAATGLDEYIYDMCCHLSPIQQLTIWTELLKHYVKFDETPIMDRPGVDFS